MSAVPLLLQASPTLPLDAGQQRSPYCPLPQLRHKTRERPINVRNSFPPDSRQESRLAALLVKATPARPYGACVTVASPQPTVVAPLIQQQPINPAPVHIKPSPAVVFTKGLTSPTAIKLFNPHRRLAKSQSHHHSLIMPRMKSLLRAGTGSGSRTSKKDASQGLPRDASVHSLSNYENVDSPEPLIRKCHTVLALSSTAGTLAHTRLVKEKKSKLDFLRRMSPSKSAVFTNNRYSASLSKSPSALSDLRRMKRESSLLFHTGDEDRESRGCSRCASHASLASKSADTVFCKLCLADVTINDMYQLHQCHCRFCKYCMDVYVGLKIREGEYTVECPDANCDCSGELNYEEIDALVGTELLDMHIKFRENTEVDMDPLRTWCPQPGCETVVSLQYSKLTGPQLAKCLTCTTSFCAACQNLWTQDHLCHMETPDNMGVPNDESIKRCPSCKVPIERDAGCAQMLCKKCKHVFCWYCLTSLDDDFLLRHYDKGPCKNKLGHSRASVLWHRAQVIGIFAGFGLLLVVASPLLLFVGPCLLCCKCKPCVKHQIEEEILY
ncbi:unnamed protein product, partial [Meganyctiphanes norvegica]